MRRNSARNENGLPPEVAVLLTAAFGFWAAGSVAHSEFLLGAGALSLVAAGVVDMVRRL